MDLKHQISTDDGQTWHEFIPSTMPLQGATPGYVEPETTIEATLTEKILLDDGLVRLKFEDAFQGDVPKEDADTLIIGQAYTIKL